MLLLAAATIVVICFALAATREEAQQSAAHLQSELTDPDVEVWVTKCIAHGIHLAESEN